MKRLLIFLGLLTILFLWAVPAYATASVYFPDAENAMYHPDGDLIDSAVSYHRSIGENYIYGIRLNVINYTPSNEDRYFVVFSATPLNIDLEYFWLYSAWQFGPVIRSVSGITGEPITIMDSFGNQFDRETIYSFNDFYGYFHGFYTSSGPFSNSFEVTPIGPDAQGILPPNDVPSAFFPESQNVQNHPVGWGIDNWVQNERKKGNNYIYGISYVDGNGSNFQIIAFNHSIKFDLSVVTAYSNGNTQNSILVNTTTIGTSDRLQPNGITTYNSPNGDNWWNIATYFSNNTLILPSGYSITAIGPDAPAIVIEKSRTESVFFPGMIDAINHPSVDVVDLAIWRHRSLGHKYIYGIRCNRYVDAGYYADSYFIVFSATPLSINLENFYAYSMWRYGPVIRSISGNSEPITIMNSSGVETNKNTTYRFDDYYGNFSSFNYSGTTGPFANAFEVTALPTDSNAVYYSRMQFNHRRPESQIADPIDASTGAHVIHRNMLNVDGARPISFELDYNSTLLNQGNLGKSWSHGYEVYLEQSNGNIIVHWTANQSNVFKPSSGNSFASTDSTENDSSLRKNDDGSFTLQRQDQKIYYFNQAGYLTKETDRNGKALLFAYDTNDHLTSISEPISGQALTLQYNNSGFISNIADNLARNVNFSYDSSNNLIGITDTGGQTVTYTYDGDGRVLTVTSPDGGRLISDTYDTQGRVATQQDALEKISTFTYDTISQPGKTITTFVDRNGNTRVLTHNDKNELLGVRDEMGNTTTYTYDSFGNRLTSTDAKGNITTNTYDARHNVLTVTDAADNITTMTYDVRNNLLTVQNTAGKTIINIYDANNNLTGITDPIGNTISYTYNNNGQMLTKTVPGQSTTLYNYLNGKLHSQTDALGNTVTFGYDPVGRLVSTTDAAGKTTAMAYDAGDNLLSVTDPLGNITSYTYDSRHNKLSQTDAKGNFTRYYYNGNGKLIGIVDALGNVAYYEYDGEDRLVKTIDAKGNATTSTLDSKGRVTAVTDPLGNTTTMQYDAVDNLVGVIDSLGNQIYTTTFDVMNNPLAVTDALGRIVTKRYDNLNRLVEVVDAMGRNTSLNYDDLNRLVSVVDALNGNSSQEYNAAGNRTALVDPNDHRTTFNFDNDGRLASETISSGGTITYDYNVRNLLAQITNARGQLTTYNYDDAGSLLNLTDPTGTVSYTYDANGNVLTASDSNGTLTRVYDDLNRVVDYTDSNGNLIHYGYDAAGNLTSLTYPDGKQVQYQYDAANRMTKVSDWAGRITNYEYDANGRLVKITRPDGSIQTQSYDATGQLLQQKDVDQNGNVINQYDFSYDNAGNVSGESSNNQLQTLPLQNTTMTYGNDNRLATYNGQNVAYDADGNMTVGPLAGNIGSYSYDSRNRLISAGTTSYVYDAENRRIGVNENGNLTSYVINPTSLSQTLVKTDTQGNMTYYVYGLGLLGQEQAGVYLNYHFDRRGSTTALTDMTGVVTDRFQYASYGELASHVGTTSTQFLFNGRDGVMTDSNGLYYMRARYSQIIKIY